MTSRGYIKLNLFGIGYIFNAHIKLVNFTEEGNQFFSDQRFIDSTQPAKPLKPPEISIESTDGRWGDWGWMSRDFKMLFFTRSDIRINISTQEFFQG